MAAALQMRYRHGPPPFARRMGCALFALIVLAAIAAYVRGAAGLAIVAVIAVVFMTTMRRAAHFVREQQGLRRQLMADVAHELRTPITILQGRVEGLLDGVYPRDDEHLKELLAETRHLSRLVEDVRTIANAEAGALELRKERVDLGELIREAASAIGCPITIEVDDLPDIDVDPVRIREVLLNLLANAAQHAPDGTVSISARSSSNAVVIKVRDNGPGIPADELPHIFERFQKGPRSQGSGLGLAIARRLVLAHDGTIDVQSRAGEGTTVTVTLPRR